jgi:8-oxo-dGTP diphosphatase
MKVYPILFSQIYCIKKGKVLLLRRTKEPNLNLWVAPGGKIEANESPYQCAERELLEESGLKSSALYFRGMISLVFPDAKESSIQFIYLATEFTGNLRRDNSEGILKWHSLKSITSLPMPAEISSFFSKIINTENEFYQAKITYDEDYNVLKIQEY